MIRSFSGAVLCLLALSISVGCLAQSGSGPKSTRPTPILEVSKVLLVKHKFQENKVQQVEAVVAFGAPLIPQTTRAAYHVSLRNAKDDVLYLYSIDDPREGNLECEQPPDKCGAGKSGPMKLTQVEYVAKVPFLPEADHLKVEDAEGKLVATTDLVPAIQKFCAERTTQKEQPQDKDCLAWLKVRKKD